MKRTHVTAIVLVAGAALAAGAFHLGRTTGRGGDSAGAAPPAASAAEGRRILYWHDPMVPGPRFDKPGKSPFMDMQLVPVYAGAEAESAGVQVSPGVQQNFGIRLATVRRAELASSRCRPASRAMSSGC